jgi:hypothetical protein
MKKSSSTIITLTNESSSSSHHQQLMMEKPAPAPVVDEQASVQSHHQHKRSSLPWVTREEEAWLKTALAVCVLRKRRRYNKNSDNNSSSPLEDAIVAASSEERSHLVPTFSSASHLETMFQWACRRLQTTTQADNDDGIITESMVQAVPSNHICQQLSFLSSEQQQDWIYHQCCSAERNDAALDVFRVLLATSRDPMLHIALMQALGRYIQEYLELFSFTSATLEEDGLVVKCLKVLEVTACCGVLAPATCLDLLEGIFGVETLEPPFDLFDISQSAGTNALIRLSLYRLVEILLQEQTTLVSRARSTTETASQAIVAYEYQHDGDVEEN